ncbi:MerR family transcriptional regulator [Streptomyces sp. RS10V-4]|uniref:transcriptional regulator FtsR n=1 Tax=Streptomyces rhizoryzae TaxID=2932493 RepID=UPI00200357B7|nr:MerR family transcriptional regulator [Streptomyces rhizoryzae]MCK7627925.1 MerR family transcriptional regulator [Streptomyces rhizoryzae]
MRHTPTGGAGPSGTASSGPSDRKPMSIGRVLNVLREEFPEVTISKIRFLESEGLVEPQRTPSGYRKFTAADVERLANVLRMQRDHYLPLKVIKEHLDALERGEQVQLPAPAAPPRDLVEGVLERDEDRPTAARIGRPELLAATGVTEEVLAGWESYGLIVPQQDGEYDIEAVGVAKLVAELGRFGLEPRHLRAVKAAAEREAGLVEQVVAPLRRHRNPQTRAHAEATARELATLSVRLHAALLQSALRVRLP